MKIGEMSKRTGVSIRMLRHYETLHLLKPNKSATGYRYYSDKDIKLVKHIKELNGVGLSLDTLAVLLPCLQGETSIICPALKQRLQDELDNLEARITHMQHIHHSLSCTLYPK